MIKTSSFILASVLLSVSVSNAAKKLSGTLFDQNGIPLSEGRLHLELICSGQPCVGDQNFTIGPGGYYEFSALSDLATGVTLTEIQSGGKDYSYTDNYSMGNTTVADFQLTVRPSDLGNGSYQLDKLSGPPQISYNRRLSSAYPTGNLIANSSFESEVVLFAGQATHGWAGQWGGIISRVGAIQYESAQHGSWSLQVSTTSQSATNEFQGADFMITEEDPAFKTIEDATAAGRPLTISAWVRGGGNATGKSIVFGNVHTRGTSTPYTFTDGNWHKIHYTFSTTLVHPNTFAYRFFAFSVEEEVTSSSAFTFFLDNVVLSVGEFAEQEAIESSFELSDGEGKLLQSQIIEEKTGSDALSRTVTKTDYDVIGRLSKTWLPFSESCTGSDCMAYSNSNPNDFYQGGTNGLPDAQGFAFESPIYENDPLTRILSTSKAGALYQPAAGHLEKTSHSATNDLSEVSLGTNRATPSNTANPLYSYIHVKDANGHESMVWKDQLGNVVKQSRFETHENKFISSSSVYDDNSRLTKTIPPMSCEDSKGNATPLPNCVLPDRMEYDQVGHIIKETSPDFGEIRKAYNVAGQLRASQSQSQKSANQFVAYKYNKFGQLVETGLANGDWESLTSPDFVDNAVAGEDEIENPEALVFKNLKDAYNGLKSRITQIRSADVVTIYQVVSSVNNEIEPEENLEITSLLDIRGHNIELDLVGILRGSQEYFDIMAGRAQGTVAQGIEDADWPNPGANYQVLTRNFYDHIGNLSPDLKVGGNPFILPVGEDAGYSQGRLVASVNYNPQLATLFPSLQERAVSSVFKYDAFGNVISEFKYIGTIKEPGERLQEVDNTYDVSNRLLTKTVWKTPSGSTCADMSLFQRFSYDGNGRLEKVMSLDHAHCNNEVQVAKYSYFPNGKIQQLLLGENGAAMQIQYSYHVRGWLTGISAAQVQCAPNGGPCNQVKIFSQDLRYDANLTSDLSQEQFNGNIAEMLYYLGKTTDHRAYVYDYDGMNRLLHAYYTADHSDASRMDGAYTYLDDGRIKSLQRGGVTQASTQPFVYYPNSNRLKCVEDFVDQDPLFRKDHSCTGVSHEIPRYYYDADGNRVSSRSDGVSEISYDWRGLPWKFTVSGGYIIMAYDALGNRVSKINYSVLAGQQPDRGDGKHYVGSEKEINELANGDPDFEIANLSGTGSIGRILATGIKEYYVYNNIGSLVTKVSETGDWTNQSLNDYFPYGKQVKLDIDNKSKVTPAFTGKELDDELGLNYFGARYYDPDLATWISPDPAKQFHSPYTYGDPINEIDPDGLAKYQMALYLEGGRYYRGEKAGDYFTIPRPKLDAWATSITKELNKAGITDLEVKVVTNPKEALEFLSQGKYNALLAHGSAKQAALSRTGKDETFDLAYSDLENTAATSNVKINVFGCFSGKYAPKYPHLEGNSIDMEGGSGVLSDAKNWIKSVFSREDGQSKK